jgi:hypothetical protein
MEYGVSRSRLRQFMVEKSHVVNLTRVLTTYPALKGVLEYLVETKASVEEVADAIRGVPKSRDALMEKTELNDWFVEHILRHPDTIPDDCQYKCLEELSLLNPGPAFRSKMLYEKKMKEEVIPMEVVRCHVHNKKKPTFLKLSTYSRACVTNLFEKQLMSEFCYR